MEANTQLLQRHFVAKEALKKAAQPYIDNNTLREKSKEIADTLGVSFQTVLNYAYGMTNDGFLTEAITKELKKYKK